MKRFLILLGKTGLGMLSIAVTLLLYAEGWAIWHFDYEMGLPDERRISALPTTGHLCSAKPESPYTPLGAISPLLQKAVLATRDLEFYERAHASPLIQFAMASDRRRPWSSITLSVSDECLRILAPACCTGPRSVDWQIGSIVFMGRIDQGLTRERILESYL